MNMNNLEKLIKILLDELGEKIDIPENESEKFYLYKTLVNIRLPKEIDENYLSLEDEFLQSRLKGNIIDINNFKKEKIFLFKGDITKLNCDAIVNPGNEKGLGCFEPSHDCLDNKINVNAGMRLRLACNEIMSNKKYHLEKAECIITKAFNLPSKYIIETNAPIINKKLEEEDKEVLKNCYINALKLAQENNIKTIAFPCIATGQFNFPNKEAAEIAYNAINEYSKTNSNDFEQIIICTYKDIDYNYYKLLINSK